VSYIVVNRWDSVGVVARSQGLRRAHLRVRLGVDQLDGKVVTGFRHTSRSGQTRSAFEISDKGTRAAKHTDHLRASAENRRIDWGEVVSFGIEYTGPDGPPPVRILTLADQLDGPGCRTGCRSF
jgi:hypothetical protein